MKKYLSALAITAALSSTALAAELRTNINADPAMVDPITYSELIAGDVMANVYEGFVALDAEGNVVPALAGLFTIAGKNVANQHDV